jgi:hypothetical protein
MEWVWDYFENVRGVQILNRSVEARVNWNDSPNPPTPNSEESTPTSAKRAMLGVSNIPSQ